MAKKIHEKQVIGRTPEDIVQREVATGGTHIVCLLRLGQEKEEDGNTSQGYAISVKGASSHELQHLAESIIDLFQARQEESSLNALFGKLARARLESGIESTENE